MKITITELRKIIRGVVSECMGWPVESTKPLYGVESSLGKPSPYDGKNSPLRFPKGKNSRRMNESFSKITAKELSEWQSGNWGFVHEDAALYEMCEVCGGAINAKGNSVIPENVDECGCV